MPLDPVSPAIRLPPREPGGAADLLWNGFRPLARVEDRPGDERRQVHRVNVARRRLDLADFEAFLGRFVSEARRCDTLAALAAHGRPTIPTFPWEPGATRGENADLAAVNARFLHALTDALAELGQLRARLEGRRAPLDVRLEAAVALEARVGAAKAALEATLPGRAVSATLGTGAAARCGVDRAGEARCGGTVPGASITRGRVDALEARVGPAYGRVAGDAVAAGVAAGVRLGGDRLSVRAEVKAGLEVQLLDAETVRRALSREDRWIADR